MWRSAASRNGSPSRAPAAQYATPQALADYEAGEVYSFIQFVGMHGDGMASKVDLPALRTTCGVPILLLQGTEDLLTVPADTRRYDDSVAAPRKQYIAVSRTGHDPNQPMVEAQFQLLQEHMRPLTR